MPRASTVERGGTESGTMRTGTRAGEPGGGSTSTDPPPSPERTDLPRDLVFRLLSATRRRRVLEVLDENGGAATLGVAAERVAAAENGVPVERLSSDQRKRVYVGLYQNHLPKLDDANVIDFDPARGRIELGERADLLFPYLYFDPDAAERTPSDGGPGGLDRLHALAAALVNRVPL
ncbi:DUF7344 domain-containing protein [Halorarum halobium]|uniref:DUF7344 domain-containing protein n=1 Tax=Halorarum halobium TaxID=3075121 RepID=UPI0028AB600B|nr:hypothetical protein [Halobaculum sp. XH14]